MSHQVVGGVIHCLLTEEDVRIRFAIDPVQTLVDLSFRGYELSPEEMDVFLQTDARTWFWGREVLRDRVH